MARRPASSDVKKEFLKLTNGPAKDVDLAKALTTLANHEAAIEMLARSQPGVDKADLRRSLAATAALLKTLESWSAPGEPVESSALAAGQAREDFGAGESFAEAGRENVFDDPSAIARVEKVKVYLDGACKGNPGPAAVGFVVTDLEGKMIYEDARFIGSATNNVAEYRALIEALKTLVENGRPETYAFSDSELLVNQMRGNWKIKNAGIKPLVIQAQALRRQLPRFQIAHVPRAQNRRADKIANLAIKQFLDASVM